jgi:TetR/AcrR family transcriptional regulator, copper-responsive repressor
MEKTRGRPRCFDRDAALDQAMRLFWQNGYDSTSLADLTKAMGINPPSLYAAFGDKEALFLEAIERYSHGASPGTATILDQAPTAREAFAELVEQAAVQLVQKGHPLGCMVLTAYVSAASPHAQRVLTKARAATEELLRKRIERGVRDGDVPKDHSPSTLAAFFMTVLEGMSLQARDGATARRLRAIGETALMAWPSGGRGA